MTKLIRLLADADIDQLIELLGFECDYVKMIAKGLIDISDGKVNGLLYYNRHNIINFNILGECDYVKLFEKMYTLNRQDVYYASIDEHSLAEQIALRELHFECYKIDKKKYRFRLENCK